MSHCINCGCRVYGGLCVNCHEDNYIETQYLELNMDVPASIYNKSRENERDVGASSVDDEDQNESRARREKS